MYLWLLSLQLAAVNESTPVVPTETPAFHRVDQTVIPAETAVSNDPVSAAWATQLSGAVNVPPVVEGEKVIAATADGQIHAVDAATGAMAWRFSADERLWDASLRAADSRVCAGLQGGLITCLDIETGEPLWMADIDQEMQSRPALADGMLFVPTTHVGTGLENDYDAQAKLVALDADTGEIVWEAVTDNYILRRPTVAGDLVISGGAYLDSEADGDSALSRIYAFDKVTGAERWIHEADDGLPRWFVDGGEVILFSGGSEIVRALDAQSGELVWSFGPSYWMQYPIVVGDTLFLGSGDERFHALDAASGEILWQQSIDLDSLNQIGRPILRDGLIWFNAVTGDIYGLDPDSGEQVSHLDTGITARVGGTIFENFYIMGDPDGVLYAYDIR